MDHTVSGPALEPSPRRKAGGSAAGVVIIAQQDDQWPLRVAQRRVGDWRPSADDGQADLSILNGTEERHMPGAAELLAHDDGVVQHCRRCVEEVVHQRASMTSRGTSLSCTGWRSPP